MKKKLTMKKKLALIGMVVAVLIAVVILTSQMQSARPWSRSFANNQASGGVPTSVLYDRMFRMIASIRAKAAIQKVTGETVTSMRTYFKDEAQLSDEENRILEKIALDFIVEVREFDDPAARLAAQIRTQFTDGDVPDGQVVPAPPAELVLLQARRDELALRYRERLNEEIGEKQFQSIDKFLHGGFASNFQSVPLSSIPQGLREERK